MGYSIEAIERQLRLGEDSEREFKEVVFSGDEPKKPIRNDWADEIAAFANAAGGVLLASVSDDGTVMEMSRAQITNLSALLTEVCTDTITPPVRIRIYHQERSDGALVLLAEVPEGEAAHESPGGRYIRVGGAKRRMEGEEWVRLAQRRAQARFLWFDKQTVPGTGVATLDATLWKPLLSAEGAANPEAALRRLALLADDDTGVVRATVAGVLLCTRNPHEFLPHAFITATRYRGSDRTSGQIDTEDITGPLHAQILGAVRFAVRNMQVGSRKAPARVDLPQYSDQAIFEAVVNAIVHRDYSIQGSRIRLSMFDDRLELVSPGSLPNNLTVESMAERQSTRNEALTSVLVRMPIGGIPGGEARQFVMERRGDGVPIITRETRELCGKDPVYAVIDQAEVQLVIPAAPHAPSAARPVITVWSGGRPLAGVDLLVLFPNNTWTRATSDEQGEAEVELHTTELAMTVFAAAPGYAAHLERQWIPRAGALVVNLDARPAGGSVIFPEATGQVPGLQGSLYPILDTHGRTYLYAPHIAINDGAAQPVYFVPGDELRLTDTDGTDRQVRMVAVEGRSALVEYDVAHKGDET